LVDWAFNAVVSVNLLGCHQKILELINKTWNVISD
jgi:hypothetical protein